MNTIHEAGVRRSLGIGELLALGGALAYATVNALLRSVARDIDPFVGSLIRQLPLFLITMTLLMILRPAALHPGSATFIGTKSIPLLLGAGVMSFFVGNVLLFAGLSWIGLAVATAASQGGMVLGGAAISAFMLREPPVGWQRVGIGVVALGIVIAALPSVSTIGQGVLGLLGFLVSFIAGVCYTLSNAASRSIQKGEGRFVVTLALTNLGGVIALTIAVLARSGGNLVGAWNHLTTAQLVTVIGAGTVNAVAVGSVTLAVRYTTVASVSMILSLVIVFGVMIAWLAFGEIIQPAILIGAATILIGVIAGQLSNSQQKSQ